jgi:hypothetical protein
VAFNVAVDDTSKCAHQVIDLSGGGTANRVGDTDSVHADCIHGSVEREKIDQVGAERVLG